MSRGDFECLTKQELIDLVLKLHRLEKNSRISSKPSTTDHKERHKKSSPSEAKPEHEIHERALTPDQDHVVEHQLASSSAYGDVLAGDLPAEVISVHDCIDLPPVRPVVVQRKVTNSYRAIWAAKGQADVRTFVATAALRTTAAPFATLLAAITA